MGTTQGKMRCRDGHGTWQSVGLVLFRISLNPDDLRRLLNRAMEQDETAAIVREIAG